MCANLEHKPVLTYLVLVPVHLRTVEVFFRPLKANEMLVDLPKIELFNLLRKVEKVSKVLILDEAILKV